MAMSRTRFDSIYTGLSSVAKKVYDAVPMNEPWSVAKIIAELQRQGIGVDYRQALRCLNLLMDAGLVHEPQKTAFRREAIRDNIAPQQPMENDSMKQTTITIIPTVMTKPEPAAAAAPIIEPAIQAANPLDRLEALAKRVAGMQGMMKELAEDISDAAIDIQAQLDANTEKVRKAKQAFAAFREMSELTL